MALKQNITLAEVVDTLAKPQEYVRRVLENMTACRRKFGSATVALGQTGDGIAPHYKVSPDILSDWQGKIDPREFFRAYHGKSHKQLEWSVVQLQDGSWSDLRMNYDEVQQLLGRLRKGR